MLFRVLSIVAAAALIAAPSLATTFDFTSSEWSVSDSISMNEDGIGLEVTASTSAGGAPIFQSRFGLGVYRSHFDSPQVDGFGRDEALEIVFDQPITLLSASFSFVGRGDDVAISVDGAEIYAGEIPSNWTGNGRITFNPAATGEIVGFTVTDWNDDYFLKSVEVRAANGSIRPTSKPPLIPEPSAALVFPIGISAAWAARRRLRG